jgi:hypothetical protein
MVAAQRQVPPGGKVVITLVGQRQTVGEAAAHGGDFIPFYNVGRFPSNRFPHYDWGTNDQQYGKGQRIC